MSQINTDYCPLNSKKMKKENKFILWAAEKPENYTSTLKNKNKTKPNTTQHNKMTFISYMPHAQQQVSIVTLLVNTHSYCAWAWISDVFDIFLIHFFLLHLLLLLLLLFSLCRFIALPVACLPPIIVRFFVRSCYIVCVRIVAVKWILNRKNIVV